MRILAVLLMPLVVGLASATAILSMFNSLLKAFTGIGA